MGEFRKTVEAIIQYFKATAFKRLLTYLVGAGVLLLGLSWWDLIAFFLGKVIAPGDSLFTVILPQIIGIMLIICGIFGHVYLYLVDGKKNEKIAASNLIGRLRVLIAGFEDTSVQRNAGYYDSEIVKCKEAAEIFIKVAPSLFSGHRTVAAIAHPKFDVSKKGPYFDVSINDLKALIEELGGYYGIK